MPVHIGAKVCRLEEGDFKQVVFEMMRCVFDIHNEFGRFFDEKIYKRELARRYPAIQLEVPLEVVFEDFKKSYFLDALAENGAPFEFKAVETLADRHRAQLLHYLFMAELPHGKLVNLRTEQVQHEFVNATLRLSDRTRFVVNADEWQEVGAGRLKDWFAAFVRDIGVGLDNSLYEEALTHVLGGEEQVVQDVNVISSDSTLGQQAFRLVVPDVALKVTSLSFPAPFDVHAKKLLQHTRLKAIQWINISRKELTFRTIRK